MDGESQLPRRPDELISAARDGIEDFSIRDIQALLRALQEANDKLQRENAALNSKLRDAQTCQRESLSTLAGGIAHNFNNLLMVVSGMAALGLMDPPKDARAGAYLEEIKNAALRAAHLSDQMRAYSGKGHAVLKKSDVNELLRAMKGLFAGAAGQNITLNYELAEELPAVEIDVAQIRQAITNLVSNAIEAIGQAKGQITVRTGLATVDSSQLSKTQPGQYVFVEVADTGCGMAMDVQPKVFDPFFTTKFTGRGLGLAVVQGVAIGHRGTVVLASQPGHGATFRLLLPATVQGQPAQAPQPDQPHSARAMVLIVDDDESILNLTRLMLEKAGLSVVTASDGQTAVELFQYGYEDIGAVLLDIAMPGLGGENTFRQLQAIRNDIPIFVCSGFGEGSVVQDFVDMGCDGFFQKPYDFEKLIRMLRAIVQPSPGE